MMIMVKARNVLVGGLVSGLLLLGIDFLFGMNPLGPGDLNGVLGGLIAYSLNGILLYYFYVLISKGLPYKGFAGGFFYGFMIFYFTYAIPLITGLALSLSIVQAAFMELLRDVLKGLAIYAVNLNISGILKKV